jgi:hypothetical protein
MVRCTRCGSEWVPIPDPAAAGTAPHQHADTNANSYGGAEMAAETATLTAMERLAAVPVSRQSQVSLLGAWLLTFVVLSGAIVAMVAWREPIVRAWPPLGRILPTNDHMSPQTAKTTGTKAE